MEINDNDNDDIITTTVTMVYDDAENGYYKSESDNSWNDKLDHGIRDEDGCTR